MATDRAALTRQVKEANDIVAVINGYLSLQPAGGGGTLYKGLCPFHNDHRPSMQVDAKWQNFHCWSCGKKGDVFTFIQEYEKVSFLEARAILARRANIAMAEDDAEQMARLRQLEAIRWAAEQYHECLLDSPQAEAARFYLGERKLLGETVRQFGLGFAPPSGNWLVGKLPETTVPMEVFEQVGLIGKRDSGKGYYDRFRDRVMFPIRNAQGQSVGFGGRVLPGSPLAERGPKYYNSSDTPLFSKSELIYGLDVARHSAATAGYLAVVEGYTDVLMAHQAGVTNVVATMGTALNARHVRQLQRYAQRVVLVFDADEGGTTGIDRALEIFAGHNIELAIATLPEGLDPCDLLVRDGPDAFRRALNDAVDALDFKLNQLLEREAGRGVEGQRRVIDAVLGVIALAPDDAVQSIQVKRDLMLTRIAHRLGVREETIRGRLRELRQTRRETEPRDADKSHEGLDPPRAARPPAHERELIELLLAHADLLPEAMEKIAPAELTHPGLRQLLEGLYDLQRAGEIPDLDALRPRIENPRLAAAALDLRDVGRQSTADPGVWFCQVISTFERRRTGEAKEQLKNQLTVVTDHDAAKELLRKLQE